MCDICEVSRLALGLCNELRRHHEHRCLLLGLVREGEYLLYHVPPYAEWSLSCAHEVRKCFPWVAEQQYAWPYALNPARGTVGPKVNKVVVMSDFEPALIDAGYHTIGPSRHRIYRGEIGEVTMESLHPEICAFWVTLPWSGLRCAACELLQLQYSVRTRACEALQRRRRSLR